MSTQLALNKYNTNYEALRLADSTALAGGPSEALALSEWRETGRALGPS